MRLGHHVWGLAFGVIASLVFVPDSFGQDAVWAVPEASIRFQVRPGFAPSHKECGYIVRLPDGGILPGPKPLIDVRSAEGKPIPAYVLWHNALSGLTLVIADPGSRADLYVYISGANNIPTWNPETGLKPSPLLCTTPGGTTLNDAEKLARFGTVGPLVHNVSKAGIREAPLSVGGDESGRPPPASFYLLTHVVTTDPGKTWIAPFTLGSDSYTVRVNGDTLQPKKRIDKWGGTGQYFQLPAGLNRIELFATLPSIPNYNATTDAKGAVYLTWRTPNATLGELGGPRPDDVPFKGTSSQETRVFRTDEVARSGESRIIRVASKSGAPVAVIQAKATQNFWFKKQTPQILYELSALTEGHPEDTIYRWEFGQGSKIDQNTCTWLLPGLEDSQISLTVASGSNRSKATLPIFGFTNKKTSLDDAETRRDYRAACLDMLTAYPEGLDPTRSWSKGQWSALLNTIDYGKGYYLFDHLFSKRWNKIQPTIKKANLWKLQDAFLDVAPRKDPTEAIAITRGFRDRAVDPQRKSAMMIREAEMGLFYLGLTNQVEQTLQTAIRIGGDGAELARIRLGDLALINGDLNRATAYYAGVQTRVKLERNKPATSAPGQVRNWRLSALLDVAAAEKAKTQIEQGYLLEASQTIREWERQFPLSKITGDLILQESRLHMETKNYTRARPMLEAYCNTTDASSHLPDAADALLECMIEMKAPHTEILAFAKDMRERLKFHPMADRFKENRVL